MMVNTCSYARNLDFDFNKYKENPHTMNIESNMKEIYILVKYYLGIKLLLSIKTKALSIADTCFLN